MTDKRIFLDVDLDTSILQNKQIGIVGYGSQGRAQASNLRDGGFSPLIGVRGGKSFDRARLDQFQPMSIEEVSGESDIVMVLTPDETHPDLCHHHIIPFLRKEAFLGFAAAFSVHFGLVRIPEQVRPFLAAPKGPGDILRQRYESGSGIPGLVAARDGDVEALEVAMAYAQAIGCGRVGVLKTTFREEAIADLFGEQSVLTGGLVELMKVSFDTLVENGYCPEIAYIECISEVQYIASLISKVGLAHLEDHISSTAYFGGSTRGPRIIGEETREKLKDILREIENGSFLKDFRHYVETGRESVVAAPDYTALEGARASLKMNSSPHER